MKNHKSFLAGMLTMLLITCLIGSASATRGVVQKEIEYQDIKISLDGVVLDLRDAKGNTVEPFKFGGTNYVPARALAEALGLTVAWDGATSTVVLARPQPAEPIQQETEPVLTEIRGRPANTEVYVSNRSNTIHSVSDCSGMRNYRTMTLGEAEAHGYSYCNDCW